MAISRTIARPYAAALFDLASRNQALDLWSAQLVRLAQIAGHSTIAQMLADPALPAEVKSHHLLDLIDSEDKAAPAPTELRNFVRLLGVNKRLDLLAEVSDEFERLKAEAQKRHQVFVTTAYALEEKQRARLEERLSRRLGGQVEIHERLAPELIGGAVIRHGDEVIDGSLRGRLSRLGESLRQRAA